MDEDMYTRLNTAGFVETTVGELFGLNAEELEMIETRLALSKLIKELRSKANVSQTVCANLIGSEQGNISRAENGDGTLSLDWLIRAAYALGADRKQLGNALLQ